MSLGSTPDGAWNPRANSVFLSARELPAGPQREEFVREACGADQALRGEVDSLLAAEHGHGDFLEGGACAEGVASARRIPFEGPGDRVGAFKLLEEIGEGGMGLVFLAEQMQPVRRMVALKIIKPGMDSRGVIARFEAERQALALMDHPNIAKVFDAGATETGRPYFVMELVRGVPITAYCDERQLPVRERLALLAQVCHAVQHAHQKGIIHRDLKPSNVMVALYDGAPAPKVIDFGVAKAVEAKLTERTLFTAFGSVVGTLEYMSPEQAELNQLDVDTRSDVYSLGVMLYELLTGATPLDRDRLKKSALHDALRLIREEPAMRPSARVSSASNAAAIAARCRTDAAGLRRDLRTELDWIVMKALEKQRQRRYESAAELMRDIERFLDGRPVQAAPPSLLYRLRKMTHRNKASLIVASVVAASLVAGACVSLWQASIAREALADARIAREDALATARQERIRAAEALFRSGGDDLRRGDVTQALLKQTHVIAVLESKVAGDSEPLAVRSRDAARLVASARLQIGAAALAPVVPAFTALHPGAVESVAFAPNGAFLATACKDGAARIWNAHTGRLAGPPLRHRGWVNAVAFSADGDRLLTASNDGTCRIWNAATGEPIGVAIAVSGPIASACWSPTDEELVATAEWNGVVRLWNATTGRQQGEPLIERPATNIRRIAFSPDGTRLAVGFWTGGVELWSVQQQRRLEASLAHDGAIAALQFSADGAWLATACHDRSARVWDLAAATVVSEMHHDAAVAAVAFSPTKPILATGTESQRLQFWNVETGDQIQPVLTYEGAVVSLAFDPDGTRIAAGSEDHALRVWDLAGLEADPRTQRRESAVTAVCYSADGTSSASSCDNGRVVVEGVPQETPRSVSLEHDHGIQSLALSPRGDRLAAGAVNGEVHLWEFATAQAIHRIAPHQRAVSAVAFSPDGARIALASDDYTARVYDAADLAPVSAVMKHDGMISCLAFSPDGRSLATGSEDQTVRFWDARSGEPREPPLRIGGWVQGVDFSPDGARIASASWARDAQIWDVASRQPLGRPLLHEAKVSGARFSPDGRVLATSCWDNTAQFWDATSGAPLGAPLRHAGFIHAIAFKPDSSSLSTGCADGLVRHWHAPREIHGDAAELQQWTRWLTAAELTEDGEIKRLSVEASAANAHALWASGGPDAQWMTERRRMADD